MSQSFVVSTGVDVLEVERVKRVAQRHGERFYKRFFTDKERALAEGHWVSLTGRIAAKEAVSKALGTGIGEVRWVEIEVLNDQMGKPFLVLHGAAFEVAAKMELTQWSLSITHTKSQAIAFVVAVGMPA